jgi:hypothetical protein
MFVETYGSSADARGNSRRIRQVQPIPLSLIEGGRCRAAEAGLKA